MKGDNLAFGEGPGGLRPQQTQFTVQEGGGGRPGRRACLAAGVGVAALSRRQYCAPLSKSQMEQRAFFHLAALKVTPPMATCGSGATAALRSRSPICRLVRSGPVSDASFILSAPVSECDI